MSKPGDIRRARAVVVGSGAAGLSAALGLGECTVLTRGKFGSGSSGHAQGGVAAALAPDDSAAQHAADTLAVSAGLGDSTVAQAITGAAAGRIEWLRGLGAGFDLDADGQPALGREAGHRRRRIVHAGGDATGAEIMRALTGAVLARPDIEVLTDYELIDLLHADDRVAGVLALAPGGVSVAILAPAVILATGGIGGLYARTTNPPEVTGDGLAVAARAGAALADLEFVQFHPTALDSDAAPAPLLTEALRGEGAVLLNDCGERFMLRQHPDAELAPRDVLARAVWTERAEGRGVFLDASAAIGRDFPRRFPSVYRAAIANGFDPCTEGLPVTPAEHYYMGGIATDLDGKTSLPGLWAVGEVAATGLHGANRLASNSLLEAMALGAAAGLSVGQASLPRPLPTALEAPAGALRVRPGADSASATAIRALMWEQAGLVRSEAGLKAALAELERLASRKEPRTVASRNMLLAARLIATAALARTESRGAHWRSDYPRASHGLQFRRTVQPQRVPMSSLDSRVRKAA